MYTLGGLRLSDPCLVVRFWCVSLIRARIAHNRRRRGAQPNTYTHTYKSRKRKETIPTHRRSGGGGNNGCWLVKPYIDLFVFVDSALFCFFFGRATSETRARQRNVSEAPCLSRTIRRKKENSTCLVKNFIKRIWWWGRGTGGEECAVSIKYQITFWNTQRERETDREERNLANGSLDGNPFGWPVYAKSTPPSPPEVSCILKIGIFRQLRAHIYV